MEAIDKVVSAFTAEHVVGLTGLSMGQLSYWDRTGFFKPHYAAESSRSPYARIYSFKDVVGLRALSVLRGKHGVSLPHLRAVADKLANHTKTPWADVKFKVWNRKVYWDEPDTGRTSAVVDGQYVLFPLIEVIEDGKRGVERLRTRDASKIGKIAQHRYVSHNAPVVAGTRVPVATLVRFAEDGFTIDQILGEYPSLTRADVEAALHHGKGHIAA